MKKIIILLLLQFTAVGVLVSLTIDVSREFFQGDVIRIVLNNEIEPDEVIVCGLWSGEIKYTQGECFTPFRQDEGQLWTGIILLGAASDLPPGEYSLEFNSGEEIKITILPGEFIYEDIPLNEAMSDLRQDDGPEKARQWRILYGLLTEFNSDSIFLDGNFILPVDSSLRRTSFYGDRRKFIYTDGGISRSIHYGIDFSGVPGTEVRSAGNGRVVFSDLRILSGETVVVEHLPGVYSSYYHMRDRFVREGDMVEAGKLIGTIGATGLVTGAHLHWEIRVNGIPVAPDPLRTSALLTKEHF